jgi:hypothetical protein
MSAVWDFIDANGVDLTGRAVLQSPGDDMFDTSKTLSQEVRKHSAVSFHESLRAQRARKSIYALVRVRLRSPQGTSSTTTVPHLSTPELSGPDVVHHGPSMRPAIAPRSIPHHRQVARGTIIDGFRCAYRKRRKASIT